MVMMNCLFITKELNSPAKIFTGPGEEKVRYDVADNQLVGIQKAQDKQYDVIVLDVVAVNFHIVDAIKIIKECNPGARIIVRTDSNSKELEARIRKEKIFYYHIKSFGINDFNLALASALNRNMH